MNTISATMQRHHAWIILSLPVVVVFMATSFALNNEIPTRHYLFRCDHLLHTPG